MALGAVRAEQRTAEGDIRALVVQIRRDRRSRRQAGDVGRHQLDLVVVVADVAVLLRLRGVLLQRHASGADLEVDRGRADADQAGRGGAALGVKPVTGRAALKEQRAASFDRRVGVRGGGPARRETDIQHADRAQSRNDDAELGRAAASALPTRVRGGRLGCAHGVHLR
jgi:hypothetical protein